MFKKIDHSDKEARAYNWALFATILLLLALIIQTPARVAAKLLPLAVRNMVTDWGGSVWRGQANIVYQGFAGQLRWSLLPAKLLTLKLAADIEWLSPHSRLKTQAQWGMGQWQLLQLQGDVSPLELQAILPDWRLPPQPLALEQITLKYQQHAWTQGQGQIQWQGGAVDYVLNGQQQKINLPAITMDVTHQNNNLVLTMVEQQTRAKLALFTVTKDRLQSQLSQRLLAYSPNYRGVAEPDAIVVTTSQPWNSF
ncbi:type II secretion system protein N [Agitococcus lubricus]|uniref:Type II secretion system protein N n=1 Tax=Agitococcus lubricus TaxID=1077255 RepID=A0A2T5IUY8_9GAMM|nr:type II secretion system protein N [Agitococcus lubricus]PTQ87714.1 type II secretion system protein N (GspN) [Agitococcus lubricus]